MASSMRSKILVLLLLCFCINLTAASRWAVHLHQRDGQPTITSTDASPSPSSTGGSNGGSNGGKTTSANATVTSNSTSISETATQTGASITAITSNINGPAPTASFNFSSFNSTATPNALPLQPEITPGLSVAGVLLILSGLAYTLVGIKNKWLHIYFSAAYLASLAVTVLILYVMNPPVSNAIQGAYVVAIAMTGLILGGAAIIFTEMTEGLGCLLGGFCFSMWLLVLKPGGLLTTTSGKAIFIAALTLGGFSTSFSHYTRPYGLIIFVSFGGATAIVLGIDCFSRAGLKEYWAYLWDLNSNLFPLGATSYPLTRGIRVEIAATVIIFLAGILSQSKLWKLIKERRAQRTAARLQEQRDLEKEEENVGKRIEDAAAVDRNQWEAAYGNKDAVQSPRRDSGVGEMDSQKRGPMSEATSIRRSGEGEGEIEMSEMSSPTLVNGSGHVMMNNGQEGGPVTVRVARDVEPPPELDENGNPIEPSPKHDSQMSTRSAAREDEQRWVIGADGEARLEQRSSRRNSKRRSTPITTKSPDVIALPFKVPEGEVADDDRSSVATFADEEQAGKKRSSRRLSQVLMRRLSQRSHRNSKHFSIGEGESTEDLVIPRAVEEDRRSSLAATMDGLSDDEDMRSVRSSMQHTPDATSLNQLPEESNVPGVEANDQRLVSTSTQAGKLATPNGGDKSRPISAATIATAILEPGAADGDRKTENSNGNTKTEEPATQKSLTSSTDPKAEPELTAENQTSEEVKHAAVASAVAQMESKQASLSKDRLPPQLSRVVMSYRTNEWAKHLSSADAPDVDDLKLEEYPTEQMEEEVAAPVRVEELQQTAENAMPPPAPASRTVSQMSSHAPTRSASAQSKHPSPEQVGSFQHQERLARNSSLQSLPSQIAQQALGRSLGYRSSSSPAIPQQIVESSTEENFPPTSPEPSSNRISQPTVPYGSTSTLIGKRDTLLRNKYSYYGNSVAVSSNPEFTQTQYTSGPASRAGSDAGSIYNYPNHPAPIPDDDNISLSARRELIRQASLQKLSSPVAPQYQQGPIPFDSHQPRRQSFAPSPIVREQQLASWRASVQQDLQSGIVPKNVIERQRSLLWQERQAEDQRKTLEERMRNQRDSAFDERMRRGDMLDAHREAMRKMQAKANRASQIQS
ncbi:hypothetical protein L207DRAFT_586381 [Hyaloscypha variabilis F]|uniref:TM7S3/TM198-like domain-containing protein n=1 Tax=Hyaloscypha variabilis (strain UAMH 11265 / GT02V1 / F) TaxID=1149755 RepID=A0A2J6RDU3_HYAVF|nr:hypothetical protein L207DRAFT_586381 [Hyaloscypha variabilis F]